MSDEASDDDGENNKDKCENATTSNLKFFISFVLAKENKLVGFPPHF